MRAHITVVEDAATIETLVKSDNSNPREFCRSLGVTGACPSLKKMIEDLLSQINSASFERGRIFRDFEEVDADAARAAEHASFNRINGRAKAA